MKTLPDTRMILERLTHQFFTDGAGEEVAFHLDLARFVAAKCFDEMFSLDALESLVQACREVN